MYFYSVDVSNPAIRELKRLTNILLIEPLLEELKAVASRVILYGSCAQGTDTSRSDMDLFIVSDNREKVMQAISDLCFPQGFESIEIRPVIKNPVELLQEGEDQPAFLSEADRGILLWERLSGEKPLLSGCGPAGPVR
jgi:predicted nucleotidyltransferase